MKSSYLTAGMKPGQLFRLIRRNPISAHPETISRLLFLTQSSIWSAFFSLIEKVRYSSALRNAPRPPDPVFIVGHWRTGSTFLHQLMSLDQNLAAPTLFQVAVPDSFLVSYGYYRPIFSSMVGKHRPMDMVKLGMDEPQEDEYAIYRLTDCSPLEQIVFPKTQQYFLLNHANFIPPPEKMERWTQEVAGFYKKIHFKTRKTIISKNPFHSLRIPLLVKLFPEARFIHIGRNPCNVVPSTINMWRIVQRQNSLNNHKHDLQTSEVVTAMEQMHTSILHDLTLLEGDRHTSLRFEDLEANPVESIQKIYRSIGLNFTTDFADKIAAFLHDNGTFQKNSFAVSDEEREIISSGLPAYRQYFGYNKPEVQ